MFWRTRKPIKPEIIEIKEDGKYLISIPDATPEETTRITLIVACFLKDKKRKVLAVNKDLMVKKIE